MDLFQDEFESPVGVVYVVSDGAALRAVDFSGYEQRMHRLLARHYGRYALRPAQNPGGATSRLSCYFAGDLAAVDGLPVATNGTPFERRVWAAQRAVPAGTTASYGAIAARLGQPAACRAVGRANGANPVAIVVPCHRIVGADAGLIGYGGGLDRKRWLLAREGTALFPEPGERCDFNSQTGRCRPTRPETQTKGERDD